jgi:hypothetical protein
MKAAFEVVAYRHEIQRKILKTAGPAAAGSRRAGNLGHAEVGMIEVE